MAASSKAPYSQRDLAALEPRAAKLVTLLCYRGVGSRGAQLPPIFQPQSTIWIISPSDGISLQLRKLPQGRKGQQEAQSGLNCGAASAQRGRAGTGQRKGNPRALQPSHQACSTGASPFAVYTARCRPNTLGPPSQTTINPFGRRGNRPPMPVTGLSGTAYTRVWSRLCATEDMLWSSMVPQLLSARLTVATHPLHSPPASHTSCCS